MKNLILIIAISFITSSCAILLPDDQPETITERNCKASCLDKNQIFVDFDTDIGCFCHIR